MTHNPLLGSRISLISKKNIRYEGTLYSINEKQATVALQNVRAFGTEGRGKNDGNECITYVPPQDSVHPYLLFRGCDIKDLHVHESAYGTEPPTDPAILSTTAPPDTNAKTEQITSKGNKQNHEENELINGERNIASKKEDLEQDNNTVLQHYKGKIDDNIRKNLPITESKKTSKVKQSGGRRPKRNGPKKKWSAVENVC